MALERLRISNLRCLEAIELELDADWNFIFGPNGAGKTSLLEAVHVAGRGRSFRTRQNRLLIRHEQASFVVFAELSDGKTRHKLGVEGRRGALELQIDGSSTARAADLAALLPVHVLDPGSHGLIDAGPSERRRYVDWGVFHVEHDYLAAWRQYRRLLGQRNAALKHEAVGAALDVWSEQLIEAGTRVDASRRSYVERLAERVGRIGERLLGTPISLVYRPGWSQAETFASALTASLPRDREQRQTQVGPHRADLAIRLGGARVREAASRGQQKLVAAALVLGQVETFAESREDGGILLVDDPAAELDTTALGRLMSELGRLSVQRILTGLSSAALEPLPDGRVFHVEQGRVDRVYNT